MSKMKPALPKGTRDFGPEEIRKRQYIFNTIKKVFEKYGFQPIETPAMENLTTLEGKYGEEGDKLLFRILNSGDFLRDVPEEVLMARQSSVAASYLCEKGLRYDLTIPLARYVVMHQAEIVFPFKRYQIQPVWRADRPQKGRYREFYQCDADVIGSDSLFNEVELILIYEEVFKKLGISAEIACNNRKLLAGFAEALHISDKLTTFTAILDKYEKVGKQKTIEAFRQENIPEKAILILDVAQSKSNEEQLSFLKEFLAASETGKKGIEEINFVLQHTAATLNITLARGLDYYTGTIFEAKAREVAIGSIGGGGRYDNLTGIFGLEGLSGVGISFGIERIYDAMETLGLFKNIVHEDSITRVMFINFGRTSESKSFEYVSRLRQHDIPAELYPTPVKIEKQMKYAHARKIPFVAFVGDAELADNVLQFKNMRTGEQQACTIEHLISMLQ